MFLRYYHVVEKMYEAWFSLHEYIWIIFLYSWKCYMLGCLPSGYSPACSKITIKQQAQCQIKMINIEFICVVIVYTLILLYSHQVWMIFIHHSILINSIMCIVLIFVNLNMFKLVAMNWIFLIFFVLMGIFSR